MGLDIENGTLGAEYEKIKKSVFFAEYYGLDCISKLGSEYH